MATDSKEIRYYKGKEYELIEEGQFLTKLKDGAVEVLAETKNVLTKEEFEKVKSNRRSPHINYIP